MPLVVGALFFKSPTWDVIGAALFGVAAITDYFDGYFARANQQVTIYGKLMDPLADKFLVVSSVVMLQHLGRIHPVVTILLICRELAITGLRALASAEGVVIDASGGGKWKTGFQMAAIPMLMIQRDLLGIPLFLIGQILLYISLGLSLWSAKDYAVDFFRVLRLQRKEKSRMRRLARETRIAARNARLEAKAKRLRDKS